MDEGKKNLYKSSNHDHQCCSAPHMNSVQRIELKKWKKKRWNTYSTPLHSQETRLFYPKRWIMMQLLPNGLHAYRMQHTEHKLLFATVPSCRLLHQALSDISQFPPHYLTDKRHTFCRARSSSRTLICERKLASASSNVPDC